MERTEEATIQAMNEVVKDILQIEAVAKEFKKYESKWDFLTLVQIKELIYRFLQLDSEYYGLVHEILTKHGVSILEFAFINSIDPMYCWDSELQSFVLTEKFLEGRA